MPAGIAKHKMQHLRGTIGDFALLRELGIALNEHVNP